MSMSTTTEIIAQHWAFIVFIVIAFGLCAFMLTGGWLLGGRARARYKDTPFESGIESVGGMGYDREVVIEDFTYYHQGGDHEDTYYSITFKEYKDYSIAVLAATSTNRSTRAKTEVGTVQPAAKVTPAPKQITIGCDVVLNGRVHYDSYGAKPGKTFTNYRGKVNFINKKGSHPYHVTTPDGGWLGWVTAESVVLA